MGKDLEQEELKGSFKQNILYALKNRKNSALEIVFSFSGTHQGAKFNSRETIEYFCGDFTYKNVRISRQVVNEETAINIIIDNFHYDCFSFIECKQKIGKVECHGFGEYFGEDRFTFIYERMNCI